MTLMPSSTGEFPLLAFKLKDPSASSSMNVKGSLIGSFSVTYHICDKDSFSSIHFHGQVFLYSCHTDSFIHSSAFLGQIDMGLSDLKGMHIRYFLHWFPCYHVAGLVACSPALPQVCLLVFTM